MSVLEVERRLKEIRRRIRNQFEFGEVSDVYLTIERGRLHVGIGRGVTSRAFLVQASLNSVVLFDVWDWDSDEVLYFGRMPLERLLPEELAVRLFQAWRASESASD